jgi:hypothetical protein
MELFDPEDAIRQYLSAKLCPHLKWGSGKKRLKKRPQCSGCEGMRLDEKFAPCQIAAKVAAEDILAALNKHWILTPRISVSKTRPC